MGETTKQERDQVFKRLRGIGPNKVNYDVHVCSKKGQGSKLLQEIKNIENVKRCRDGMPKSMQTR